MKRDKPKKSTNYALTLKSILKVLLIPKQKFKLYPRKRCDEKDLQHNSE